MAIHAATLKALGMYSGVTHTEFIKSKVDGKFYFLENGQAFSQIARAIAWKPSLGEPHSWRSKKQPENTEPPLLVFFSSSN